MVHCDTAPSGIFHTIRVPAALSGQEQDASDRLLHCEFHSSKLEQAVGRRCCKALRLGHDALVERYDLSADGAEGRGIGARRLEIVAQIRQCPAIAGADSPN